MVSPALRGSFGSNALTSIPTSGVLDLLLLFEQKKDNLNNFYQLQHASAVVLGMKIYPFYRNRPKTTHREPSIMRPIEMQFRTF